MDRFVAVAVAAAAGAAAAGAGALLWIQKCGPDQRQTHMTDAERWVHGVAGKTQVYWATAQPLFNGVVTEVKLQWTAASAQVDPLYQQGFRIFKQLTDMPALDERAFMGVCAVLLMLALTLLRFMFCRRRHVLVQALQPHFPHIETPIPVLNAFALPATPSRQPVPIRNGSARRAATPTPRQVPVASPIAEAPLVAAFGGNVSSEENQSILALLNCGTAEELQTLRGIDPRHAAAIMSFRADGRKFRNLDDLVTELGLSPVRRYFQELLGGA